MERLQLGSTPDNNPLGIKLATLQRHFACFGSSGSGKTVASKVLIEELARNGVPVIAFDPQGDISSLAVTADRGTVKKSGTDPRIRDSYDKNVEVVIWTPGSSKGIPLCINPLQFDGVGELNNEELYKLLKSEYEVTKIKSAQVTPEFLINTTTDNQLNYAINLLIG